MQPYNAGRFGSSAMEARTELLAMRPTNRRHFRQAHVMQTTTSNGNLKTRKEVVQDMDAKIKRLLSRRLEVRKEMQAIESRLDNQSAAA